MQSAIRRLFKAPFESSSSLGRATLEQLASHLPKEDLSGLTGELMHRKLPAGPLRVAVLTAFAKAYKIRVDEAELPLANYESIGQFFCRKLKPGARPIANGFVSPADGKVVAAGLIGSELAISQDFCEVKGERQSLLSLLGSAENAKAFQGGFFATIYLCPTDYHRVHAPLDGRLTWGQILGGELWPVNRWAVQNVSQLYARNRRSALVFTAAAEAGRSGPDAKFSLVLVGATNVGSLQITVDPRLSADSHSVLPKSLHYESDAARKVRSGDEVGFFAMGSTVVVLGSKELKNHFGINEARLSEKISCDVRMGESLFGGH